tara:strand:- start:181 stop:891 length:711 start_codon:yes stop_codon:yes gene_type:complete
MNRIKIITFDLDDTFWDIESVIFKAEYETRNWIEKKINKKIEWGDLEDFLSYRKELIFKNPNLEWDISSLRKEIYRYKLSPILDKKHECEEIVTKAYDFFIDKRHDISFYDGVLECLEKLNKEYILGVLTNGNANIKKLNIDNFFKFHISSFDVKSNKPESGHFLRIFELNAGVKKEEVLHIGDHQKNDMLGAYELGIKHLWFNKKNDTWKQNFKKPNEFKNWNDCYKLIKDLNEK